MVSRLTTLYLRRGYERILEENYHGKLLAISLLQFVCFLYQHSL